MDAKSVWIALNMVDALTPARLRTLLRLLGGPRQVWEASGASLARAVGSDVAERIVRARQSVNPYEEQERAHRAGGTILTGDDAAYPEGLRELPVPPLVLYVLGSLPSAERWSIAIVGTRRCTSYGRLVAKRLATQLAERRITVVSGMAPGVDTAAHQGALASGRTVAVLGTGIGKPYPAGAEALANAIAASGAVVSEYPWDMGGTRWSFPRRNRLIAALGQAVVVVEAPERSGALITADRALELGKDVMAVPGPITSEVSLGSNRLLQDGAKPVTCVEDICEALGGVGKAVGAPELPMPTGDAKTIHQALTGEPLDSGQLSAVTGLPHARVARALLELQLGGLVDEQSGRRYVRRG